LELKGKGLVPAHRLRALDVFAAGVARRLERPMVGRVRERERLRAGFVDVVETRSCRLFTLIGPAGIGKSRLVADFLEHVDGAAHVAHARALSYGEGITYWPLVEILTQLGIAPSEAIRSSPAETQLATRALLEGRAEDAPLVLVIDDLQWAEPAMLELLEHVLDWSRGVPILLLCVARPELLDVKPNWAGGKLNATSTLLEPLAEGEVEELVDSLLDAVDLDPEARIRIVATAEGNPLFLEEMAALAREAGGVIEVPPSIQALLQARLDTLDDGERAVIERGAVEGHVFHRGAVTALAPEESRADVPQRLAALVRKELVRPDRALIATEDAFRFRHLLIRDTAYEALPKSTRAELHERVADWLDANAALVEQHEIVGYHFEQAAGYRRELDPRDPSAATLARRAAERLGSAGRTALGRGDLAATENLLRRALKLASDRKQRRQLIPDLADALIEGDEHGEEVGELVAELEGGDARDHAIGAVLRVRLSPAGQLEDQLARLDNAEAALAAAGDTLGLVRCERARGWAYWGALRARDAHLAWRRAHDLLRQAGSHVLHREVVFDVCISAVFGGAADTDEIRLLLDELEAEAEMAGPLMAATVRAFRARSQYMAGELDAEAVRTATDHEVKLLGESGASPVAIASSQHFVDAIVPWVEGDPIAIEAGARSWVEATAIAGTHLYHANALAEWAVALCKLGKPKAALDAIREAREIADPNDVADQILLDQAEAYAAALDGGAERAQTLLRRARERVAGTQSTHPAGDPVHIEASVLNALGDAAGARLLLENLIDRETTYGRHRVADRYRRDLDAIG
jgi:tetratricopeptide (TPR) repeat protein